LIKESLSGKPPVSVVKVLKWKKNSGMYERVLGERKEKVPWLPFQQGHWPSMIVIEKGPGRGKENADDPVCELPRLRALKQNGKKMGGGAVVHGKVARCSGL